MGTRADLFQKQVDALYLHMQELEANDKWREASDAEKAAYQRIAWDGTFEEFKASFDEYLIASKAENEAYAEYIRLTTAKTLPAEEFKIALR